MARLLRVNQAGAWYHVTARGNERKPIYRADRDRIHFVELLGLWRERFGVRLHAYVLMENHYHLLVETREANLSKAMQWLNVSYSVWFNRRHRRVGHLLQGRYKAVVVEPETWGLSLSRYIHLNPVRVQRLGLDKTAQQGRRQGVGVGASAEVEGARLELLRSHRWSSYRAFAGYEKPPAWLDIDAVLAFGGGRAKHRQRLYRRDCEMAVKEQDEARPWDGVIGRLALGSREFLDELIENSRRNERDRDVETALGARPSFAKVIRTVEELKGQPWAAFRDRRGDWGRDLALHLGRELGGLSLAKLSQAVEANSRMTVSVALRRFRERLSKDKRLSKCLDQARKELQRQIRHEKA